MIKRFKSRYRSLLGIDISPTSIKIIELSCHGHNFCIENVGYYHIPAHEPDNIEILASCLKKLVLEINSPQRFAVLAVPDSTVISKTIQLMGSLTQSELEDFVLSEAEKYLAYPADEMNIDFSLLGPSSEQLGMQEVLLVASRADNVNKRLKALEHAGLEAKIIDIESHAVACVVNQLLSKGFSNNPNKRVAVLTLDVLCTRWMILEGEKITHTLAEAITSRRRTSASCELDKTQIFFKEVLTQIKRSLQFFFSTSRLEKIDQIFLAGEFDNLTYFAQMIQEETKISTTLADPFQYMSKAKNLNPQTLASLSPSFMVACGLAMRRVNND